MEQLHEAFLDKDLNRIKHLCLLIYGYDEYDYDEYLQKEYVPNFYILYKPHPQTIQNPKEYCQGKYDEEYREDKEYSIENDELSLNSNKNKHHDKNYQKPPITNDNDNLNKKPSKMLKFIAKKMCDIKNCNDEQLNLQFKIFNECRDMLTSSHDDDDDDIDMDLQCFWGKYVKQDENGICFLSKK